MFALRVSINDKKPVVAGAEDLSVLSAIVTLSGRLGRSSKARGGGKPEKFLHLGGLTARSRRRDKHLRWLPHTRLKCGDRVLVEVIESTRAHRVVERSFAEDRSTLERSYYEHLKKEYLKLKRKYEPES